jgi:small subunit ribosomal protein S3Ae
LSRRTRRKQDKWRNKKRYTLISPPYFGEKELGTTVTEDANKLIGRVIETTLYDITGDFTQQQIKLFFQVINRKQQSLETVFKGHEYSRDFLRSLVRRGSSRIDSILKVKTKDGYGLRISITLFSVLRVRASQITVVRSIINKIVLEKAMTLNFDQFVQEAVLGKMGSDIYNKVKKIFPIRNAGVRKSKLLSFPDESKIIKQKIEIQA